MSSNSGSDGIVGSGTIAYMAPDAPVPGVPGGTYTEHPITTITAATLQPQTEELRAFAQILGILDALKPAVRDRVIAAVEASKVLFHKGE